MAERDPPPHPTPLGYSLPLTGTSTRKVLIVVLACMLGIGLFLCVCLSSILVPSLGRAREPANRAQCARNLRAIGQAILMYAAEHKGQLPDELEKLVTHQHATPEVFLCPSSDDTRAPGADWKAWAANMSKGGHLSYVYVGKGLSTVSGPGVHEQGGARVRAAGQPRQRREQRPVRRRPRRVPPRRPGEAAHRRTAGRQEPTGVGRAHSVR